ncbi:thioredoxin family protein [Prescottella equi]|uniref:thioredoxin family protein n=1 Tax=Rhodococcus hoagii TaxID=43767 RepID=UPI003B7E4313
MLTVVDIELLYFDSCPNWQVARDRMAQALAETGNAGTPITLRTIDTPGEAEREAFPGSPTIRIDGVDACGRAAGVGLTCRVYPTADGPAGAPTVTDLVAAVRRAELRRH